VNDKEVSEIIGGLLTQALKEYLDTRLPGDFNKYAAEFGREAGGKTLEIFKLDELEKKAYSKVDELKPELKQLIDQHLTQVRQNLPNLASSIFKNVIKDEENLETIYNFLEKKKPKGGLKLFNFIPLFSWEWLESAKKKRL